MQKKLFQKIGFFVSLQVAKKSRRLSSAPEGVIIWIFVENLWGQLFGGDLGGIEASQLWEGK